MQNRPLRIMTFDAVADRHQRVEGSTTVTWLIFVKILWPCYAAVLSHQGVLVVLCTAACPPPQQNSSKEMLYIVTLCSIPTKITVALHGGIALTGNFGVVSLILIGAALWWRSGPWSGFYLPGLPCLGGEQGGGEFIVFNSWDLALYAM